MALSRIDQRAYVEAAHQHAHGEPSPSWDARLGSQARLEVWLMAFDIAEYEDVSPWDALLLAVKRRAARVRTVDGILDAAWEEHRRLCAADPNYGNPDVPSDDVRKWLTESRNEERLLSRSAKMAVDAGVAKIMVERNQLEGKLIADVIVAALDVLDLTSEQRMRALTEAQRQLTAGSGSLPASFQHESRNDDGDPDPGA